MVAISGDNARHDRDRLDGAVNRLLAAIDAGQRPSDIEVEQVDVKEEAGRRGRGGAIEQGEPRSRPVAAALADEVACMANSPGGGALIIGVADDGTRVPAAAERDWLRHRIYELIDVAPAIEERHLADGTRVLLLFVAEAREPVENTAGRLRWRVGHHCTPVDRSEWWAARARRQGADPLVVRSPHTLQDVTSAALAALRSMLGSTSVADQPRVSNRELLTRLGVLLPDGHLTAAGALMFCPSPSAMIELSALDVPGGNVVMSAERYRSLSLIEQLADVERRLDVLDGAVPVESGLRLEPVRLIPWAAAREALLNAIVHRDWLQPEPVTAVWVQTDATLEVRSPGGFVGGVDEQSVLSARFSRNPALADLARAMGLVERQGVGVDRMYREMVALGHRPPTIRQHRGPEIRTRLVGGVPLRAVLAATSRIEPEVRRRDHRVLLCVYLLLRDGFVTLASLGTLLQLDSEETVDAIDAVLASGVDGAPLIMERGAAAWLPSSELVRLTTSDRVALAAAQRRGLLRWFRPGGDDVFAELVSRWLAASGRITSGDLAALTSLSGPGALKVLTRLEEAGLLRRSGSTRGRAAHFVSNES